MPFKLLRVNKEDFDEILEIQYRTFDHVELHTALFGTNTKSNRDQCKEQFILEMEEDPADYWMKAVDEETGKIVAAAQWKIYSNWVPLEEEAVTSLYHNGEAKSDAEDVMNDFFQRRAKYMYGQPHVLLYILFTDPSYQRRGAGSALVKWGCQLADRLMVPMWLEGTDEGHHLYLQNGFRDIELVDYRTKNWRSQYALMKRESIVQGATLEAPASGVAKPSTKAMMPSLLRYRPSEAISGFSKAGAVCLFAIFGVLYTTSSRRS